MTSPRSDVPPESSALTAQSAWSISAAARQWTHAFGSALRMWRPLLLFHLWFAFLIGGVFSSAFAWLLKQIISGSGDAAITNFDLARFFASPRGIAFLSLACGARGLIFFIERAGVFLLVSKGATHAQGASAALLGSVRRWLPLGRLVGWYVVIFLIPLVPVVAAASVIGLSLLREHDINYYLYHQPSAWWIALGAGAVLGLVYLLIAIVLWLRLVFALQLVLFHHENPRQALIKSWWMTRGHSLRLAVVLAGWWIFVWIATALVLAAISAVGVYALSVTDAPGTPLLVVVALAAGALFIVSSISEIVGLSVECLLARRWFAALSPFASTDGNETREPGATSLTWKISTAAILLYAVWMLINGWYVAQQQNEKSFTITAHRAGAVDAPENTLAAMERAIQDGADFAEIDVQTTRDGQLVILHDGDLMRVGNDPRRVGDLTLDEIRKIDVGRWHSPTFAGEHVPTLSELIAVARGRIRLNVELKYNRKDPSLVTKVIELLRQEKFLDQCIITSLQYSAVREAKLLAPEVDVGLIVTKSIGDPVAVDADFLSVNSEAVTLKLIDRSHSSGKEVHVWTINDRKLMERMIEMGADSLITDKPAEAKQLRDERNGLTAPELLAFRLRTLLFSR